MCFRQISAQRGEQNRYRLHMSLDTLLLFLSAYARASGTLSFASAGRHEAVLQKCDAAPCRFFVLFSSSY